MRYMQDYMDELVHNVRNPLYGNRGPLAYSTVTPPAVTAALSRNVFDMGRLARTVLDAQLRAYEENKPSTTTARKTPPTTLARASSGSQSLFDIAGDVVVRQLGAGEAGEKTLERVLSSLPRTVVERLEVWKTHSIPYTSLRKLLVDQGPSRHATSSKGGSGSSEASVDIDEWIIRNERWIRDSGGLPDSDDWHRGLVALSKGASAVFPGSVLSKSSLKIKRASSLPGYTFLDVKRAPAIQIQRSANAFAKRFESMSDHLLRGLDWSNVCVAGGIVLGALVCVGEAGASSKAGEWANSDLDLYIYDLAPLEANEKVAHIFDVFKKNLPAKAPALVVRNSKTITFFSRYPLRRVQIVLKLERSPKEVLLNFDLDPCAVCWDGDEVWMLPRFCRALETGYTVFTMNLIHGHYLGERRATQEQRIFKYADKGYGIRILPSYLASLPASDRRRKELSTHANPLQKLSIHSIAARARRWVNTVIEHYIPPRPSWSADSEERASGGPPKISHLYLDTRLQKTEAPLNRSCLTGFELLLRHTALWESACAGSVIIKDNEWASTDYEDQFVPIGYDDTPRYFWDKTFTIKNFKTAMDGFNKREARPREYHVWGDQPIRRISYANSVKKILEGDLDICIPLFLPRMLARYINQLVADALEDCGLEDDPPLECLHDDDSNEEGGPMNEEELAYLWRISPTIMWQQVDRRFDEVREVLWSFHRVNQHSEARNPDQLKLQLSRRAIRTSAQVDAEMDEFARWVGRKPISPRTPFVGPEQGFSSFEDSGTSSESSGNEETDYDE